MLMKTFKRVLDDFENCLADYEYNDFNKKQFLIFARDFLKELKEVYAVFS